jgi:membrane protease YdiL (CAAX protease family)
MLSEKPWRPDLVLRFFAALFAGFVLGALIVQGYQSQIGNKTATDRVFLFLLSLLSFHGVGIVLVHVLVREHGMRWRDAFGFNAPRLGRAIFLAVLITIMVMPIVLSLLQLSVHTLEHFDVKAAPQDAVKAMQEAQSTFELGVYGFVTVLIAPFVEEVIFRGILYPTMKQNGYRKLALWGTSLFFALVHGNIALILPLTFLAVILVFLYETTNNLLAPIITHTLFNGLNYAYLVWQMRHPGL